MGSKSLEESILEICRKAPDGQGALQSDLDEALSSVDRSLVVAAINSLLGKGRMQVLRRKEGLAYSEIKQEEADKFKGLGGEERLVYQLVQKAGTNGLWTKDMKARSNLAQPQITRILKALTGRKLIKAVKSVTNPSRKVYMLSELEPSRELTGGAWYTESQFDAEFIDVLREATCQYISRQKDTTISEIAAFIKSKGLAKVALQDCDVESIVQTLVFDGRVDQIEAGEEEDAEEDHFRPAVYKIPEQTALTSVPCGVCPVQGDCAEGGVISPQSCVYYQEWLKFEF